MQFKLFQGQRLIYESKIKSDLFGGDFRKWVKTKFPLDESDPLRIEFRKGGQVIAFKLLPTEFSSGRAGWKGYFPKSSPFSGHCNLSVGDYLRTYGLTICVEVTGPITGKD